MAFENDDQFTNFVQDEIKKIMAQSQGAGQPGQAPVAPVAATPAAPQPITVTLNGQQFTFENQDALSKALEQTLAVQASATPQPGGYVTGDDKGAAPAAPPTLDFQTYAKMVQEDPIGAQDYLDNIRYFNGQVENPRQVMRQLLENSAATNARLAVYEFKDAHPEYLANPHNAQTLDGIRKQLGLPLNMEGLEAAYALGSMRGMLQTAPPTQHSQQFSASQPAGAQSPLPQNPQFQPTNPYLQQGSPQFPPQTTQNFAQNPYAALNFPGGPFTQPGNPAAPPMVGRTGNPGVDANANILSQAEGMSAEQIRQLIDTLTQRS